MDLAKDDVVAVTGASGFIGYAVCKRLAKFCQVIGLDRPGGANPPAQAAQIDLDVTSEESVTQAFSSIKKKFGRRLASVIHLAAFYDFSGRPSSQYQQVTIEGTRRVLKALKDFQVEQFVFSSTMLVHEPSRRGERINEFSPITPKWDYPKSKVQTEQLLRREHGDMPIVLLRIAGVYNDDCHSIPIAHQIQRIYERTFESHLFPGDLSHGQSFLHLDDLVDLFQLLAERRHGLPAEVSLVCGEADTMSYGELQGDLGQLIHGKPWRTWRIPKWVAKAGAFVQGHLPFLPDPFIKPWMIEIADDEYALDISRLKALLDWRPKRTLRSTLPTMVARLKEDPVRWYNENKLEG